MFIRLGDRGINMSSVTHWEKTIDWQGKWEYHLYFNYLFDGEPMFTTISGDTEIEAFEAWIREKSEDILYPYK